MDLAKRKSDEAIITSQQKITDRNGISIYF
jgi:hypothetical protein